jgi:glycosyltransferase involved in cell wall biosynthesis
MGHWGVMNALIYPLARHYKKPYVNCPAGALPIYGRSKLLKRLYNRCIGYKIIQNASKLIATTQDEVSYFRQYGVEASQVEVIPNGVIPEDYRAIDNDGFRTDQGLSPNPFVLFVGRLNSIKGPDLLLRAFNLVKDYLPDYHLVYAGLDCGMLRELKDIVAEFRINDRVHFIGWVDGDQKSKAFHAADLLVIPSRSEVMSIVLLEAGVTATPVLVTDKCGVNEIAEIGGGQVVSASTDGVKQGLLEMLSSPDRLRSMGENLRAFVQSRFTWDIIVERYIELYGEILAKQG